MEFRFPLPEQFVAKSCDQPPAFRYRFSRTITKTLLVMKLTILLLTVVLFSARASGVAQSVTLSGKDLTLKQVFAAVKKQTGYVLFNNKGALDGTKTVSLTVYNLPLKDFLDVVLKDQPLEYTIQGKTIILSRKVPVIPPAEVVFSDQPAPPITGVVRDAAGILLSGATVYNNRTKKSVQTNAKGEFSMPAQPGDILIISFSGYQRFEAEVGIDRVPLSIVLQTSYSDLNGIVVVGYGTLQKSKVSSSMASVDPQKIENQLNVSVDRSLEGMVAGVVVKQNTGAPGGGASIKIRGAGSIGAGDDPLFVIDGIPYASTYGKERSPLAFLNPSDIESMDILKDAAASAIYGSRGANGVVLITTKSGKAGKTEITANVRTGMQQVLPIEKMDLMNAYEFASWRKENYLEHQAYYGLPVNLNDLPEAYRDPEVWKGKGFDWQNGIFRTAPMQSYNISISHGSEHFKGYFSLGYTQEEGAIIETNVKRLSMRANMVYEANKFIDMGMMMSSTVTWWGNRVDDNRGGNYGNAVISSPLDGPHYDADLPEEDSSYIYNGWDGDIFVDVFHQPNSIYNLKNIKNKDQDFNLNLQPYLQITPLKGLVLKSQLNLQFANSFSSNFQPSTNHTDWAPPPAMTRASYGTGNAFNWQFINSLNYHKTLGDHSFDALMAYTAERYHGEASSIDAWDFPNDLVTTIDASRTQIASTSESAWSILSTIYRLNYDYKTKYLLQGSLRRDGSSRFGPDRRWAYFPSVSAGWHISKEAFFPQTNWLTNLKLRTSYGLSGNNNIGDYTWISGLDRLDHNFGGNVVPGSAPSAISNTKLGWEKTKEYDLGLDLSLFKGRLNFTFDYYNKITTDMLWNVVIPVSSGFNSLWDNIGKVRNRGVEFSISSVNVSNRDFRWNTDFNISFNRNKVLNLGNINQMVNSVGFAVLNITRVGDPLAQFWGFKLQGIFNTQDEIDKSATYGTQLPGTPKWEDIDKNGVIDINDRTVIGNPFPDFTGGINNRFTYKKWDLNVNISYAYNFDVAATLETTSLNLGGAFNVTKEVKDRWKSPQEPGNGRISGSFQQTNLDRDVSSSKFIYNVSYLKFQNISLGYTFSLDNIRQCRLSLSAQNPWLITNYKYGNPDVNRYGNSTLMQGIDEYDYPLTRILELGVNITF